MIYSYRDNRMEMLESWWGHSPLFEFLVMYFRCKVSILFMEALRAKDNSYFKANFAWNKRAVPLLNPLLHIWHW